VAVALTVVEGEVLAEAEDLLLAGAEAETDRCIAPPAAIAERNAKFLFNPQTVNLCTVVIVLRKWAVEATGRLPIDPDLTTDPVLLRRRADPI